ncbi:hypothetical protein FAUST_768 [Fusarium austroamericanum]|uniref:Xylanolytic transcriptional activator regulatory domain-containing protein n=1 Tax=Fusarium austroamericanum TaxID=282268 RepID=A0AAN6CA69_FUSAU|nr:hypothetical protein FAUST_768 [Fusarium austroamericanum]
MSEIAKIRIVNEVVRRLWFEDPDAGVTLKVSLAGMCQFDLHGRADKFAPKQRYMSETDYIKDIMLAVVKDIGHAMMELDLREEKAVALNRCKFDLARAVDEHNLLTRDGYEQTFRPRLNCTVHGLKLVDKGSDGPGGSTQGDEPMMEVTLRFPARRLERLLQASQQTQTSYPQDNQYKSNPVSLADIIPPNQQNDEIARPSPFENPLPQHLVETLTNIYFDNVHQAAPMLHRQRFMASLFLPDHTKAPLCLQYIVMAFATETTESYHHLSMEFYKRARNYLQEQELGNLGTNDLSLGHVQAWALMSCFEAEHTMFAKASITLSSALRAAQMLNLHRVDIPKSMETVSTDWIKLEERRRTWWTIFCFDRFVCATTGWPALIHQSKIDTRLPASDEAYAYGREEQTSFLGDQLLEAEPHSSFAGRVLTAHMFHRTIEHNNSDNIQGQGAEALTDDTYWQRHREIDNDLKFMLLMLPKKLCLPTNYKSHNAVFVNVMLHTATICLHRAALWRMKSNLQGLPSYMIRLSQDRLIPAAEEILNIFKMIPDLGTTFSNPLICVAAYMAALVFLSCTSPAEPNVQSEENLDFILRIMVAFGDNNSVANAVSNEIMKEMSQCVITSATMCKSSLQETPVDIPLLATQRLYSSFDT